MYEYVYGNGYECAITQAKPELALRDPRLSNYQSTTAVCGLPRLVPA